MTGKAALCAFILACSATGRTGIHHRKVPIATMMRSSTIFSTAMQRTLAALLLIGMVASCSTPKTYFSQGMRKTVKIVGKGAKELQYYVDMDIELRREITSDTVQVRDGSVVFENGKFVNVIKLKKFTPGICISDRDSARLRIAFDETEDKYLTFGVRNANKEDEIYALSFDKWMGDYGVIKYEGREYTVSGPATTAQLMIKRLDKRQKQANTRVLKGRRLD